MVKDKERDVWQTWPLETESVRRKMKGGREREEAKRVAGWEDGRMGESHVMIRAEKEREEKELTRLIVRRLVKDGGQKH